MRVYLNDKITGKRKIVDARLIKEGKSIITVKLDDGNFITRKKKRDIPEGEKVQ